MDPSVRKQKSGDQLAEGDWLAPGVLMTRPAEVLFAHAYDADADAVASGLVASNGGPVVQLVVREQGATGVWPDLAPANTLFNLASDEDLARYREASERAQKIANIRALADWLEATPGVPVPRFSGQASPGNETLPELDVWNSGSQGVAELRRWAGLMGAEIASDDERTQATKTFGRGAEYRVIAWHKDGRPVEPAPEPYLGWDGPCAASLHISTPGQTCGVCGAEGMRSAQHVETMASASDTSSAECACGMVVSGFDSLAEAREQLARHIADPTGQDYGRADTAEADDPTPVSPARVPLHTGAVTDGGLVDESESGPVHMDNVDGESMCGLGATTPHRGSLVWAKVTCADCVESGMPA